MKISIAYYMGVRLITQYNKQKTKYLRGAK